MPHRRPLWATPTTSEGRRPPYKRCGGLNLPETSKIKKNIQMWLPWVPEVHHKVVVLVQEVRTPRGQHSLLMLCGIVHDGTGPASLVAVVILKKKRFQL